MWVVAAAILGCLLQTTVLGFAIWVTYFRRLLNEGQSAPSWAFPLAAAGTISLLSGMFLCAWLIERSTQEKFFQKEVCMYWLQPHNQTVGDQTFDAFAHHANLKEYVTSWKLGGSSKPQHERLVWVAVAVTMIGFILQFVGLRGLHSVVALFQLGATLVMAGVRAGLRTQRIGEDKNNIKIDLDTVEGHELDWQAFQIESYKGTWEVTHTHSILPERSRHSSESLKHSADSSRDSSEEQGLEENGAIFCKYWEDDPNNRKSRDHKDADAADAAVKWMSSLQCEKTDIKPLNWKKPNLAARIMYYRARLARLTDVDAPSLPQRWQTDIRRRATSLGQAIEHAAKVVFSGDVELKKQWRNASAIFWRVDCKLSHPDDRVKELQPIYLLVRRKYGMWFIDRSELEAVLGLWCWSLTKSPLCNADNFSKVYAFATTADQVERAKLELAMWVSRELSSLVVDNLAPDCVAISTDISSITSEKPQTRAPLSIPLAAARHSIDSSLDLHEGNSSISALFIPTKNSLLDMCAQDLFTSFIERVAAVISTLSDVNSMRQRDSYTPLAEDRQQDFRLANRHIDRIATGFVEAGLGSREDALMSIIPSLRENFILPPPDKVFDTVLSLAKDRKRSERFTEAETLLRWVYYNVTETGPYTCEMIAKELGELYRRAMRSPNDGSRHFGYNGVLSMLRFPEKSESMAKINDCYGWVAIQMALQKNDVKICKDLEDAKVKRSLVEGFETMSLPEVVRSNEIYPVGLLIVERWKDDLQKSVLDHQESLLILATKSGCTELVEDLLEKGVDPNRKDVLNRTPIFYAAEAGHYSITQSLLKAGATVVTRDKNGQMPLLLAAKQGHDIVVKLLVEHNVGPDSKDNELRTPVSLAAEHGHEAVIKLLIEKGADLNYADNKSRTPLSWAAKEGHETVSKLLIENGAYVDYHDVGNLNPLILAAINGHEAVVRLLIENGADMEFEDGRHGTPLLRAAQHGHENVVRILLEKNANVNATDYEDQTALGWATAYEHEAVINLLVVNGARRDFVNKEEGEPLLNRAVMHGHEVLVKILIEKNMDVNCANLGGETPLMKSCHDDNLALSKLLIEKGANVNAADHQGETPLMKACHSVTVSRLLIENGANVNAADHQGETPLMKTWHSMTISRLLIENGANVNAADHQGETPLMKAHRDLAVSRLLIENGANVNAADHENRTPLIHAAIFYDASKLIKLLIENGANVNAADHENKTPLIHAVQSYNLSSEVIQLLIKNGANVNAADQENKTPLIYAARHYHSSSEVIKLLIENGANVNHANDNGKTALWKAKSEGNKQAIRLLIEHGAMDDEDEKSQSMATECEDETIRSEDEALTGDGPMTEDEAMIEDEAMAEDESTSKDDTMNKDELMSKDGIMAKDELMDKTTS